MEYTNTLKLRMPLPTEKYSIEHQNENMRVIDRTIGKIPFVNDERVCYLPTERAENSAVDTNGNIVENASAVCHKYDFTEMTEVDVYVSGACSQTFPLYVMKDADGNMVSMGWSCGETSLTVGKEYFVVVPENVAVLYVNQLKTNEFYNDAVVSYSKKFEAGIKDLAEDVVKDIGVSIKIRGKLSGTTIVSDNPSYDNYKIDAVPIKVGDAFVVTVSPTSWWGMSIGIPQAGDVIVSKGANASSKDNWQILSGVNVITAFEVEKELVTPNNYIPPKANSVTKNGVTVTLVDNVVTVSGAWSVSWNDFIWFEGEIPLNSEKHFLQIWDISNDTSGLVAAAAKDATDSTIMMSVKNNEENGSYASMYKNAGKINFGVRVFPGFTATATFKMTLSSTLLDAYEQNFDPYENIVGLTLKDDFIPEKYKKTGNMLYGKKWAVCGDSFSHGDFTNALDENYIIADGKYAGKKKVYGYLIGNRNNMEIQHLAVGGRTMATPADGSFANAFSNEMYKSIDTDVDYITLYFGINDSHHRTGSTGSDGEDQTGVIELGTIDDTDISTFYGAWNVVLEYLIKNYPNARIGIIVSNGCETHDYPMAEIEIANKWGIPYIDLNGDERTPMMIRSTNPDISTQAKDARNKSWSVNWEDEDATKINKHPNAAAHEYQSVFIENWLRTL